MFTGLIEEVGKVKSILSSAVYKIHVNCPVISQQVIIGDSVAVCGTCLTVTEINGNVLVFDAVDETIKKTILKDIKIGADVNLETSLTLSKPIGGHFVSGHVDGVGLITKIINIGNSKEILIHSDSDVLRLIVKKGSVAIDGISLTVADVYESEFKIALIPHTLGVTTLSNKCVGDRVNIETDILGKYIEKLINKNTGDTNILNTLKENGFT